MTNEGLSARAMDHGALRQALSEAHHRTAAMLADFDARGWDVPQLKTINPPLWEMAHIAWFSEWWVLRGGHDDAQGHRASRRASLLPGADDWLDSGRVAHSSRWTLPLPPPEALRDYKDRVLTGMLVALDGAPDSPEGRYPWMLALFHEDMHGEALCMLRQTLEIATHLPTPQDQGANISPRVHLGPAQSRLGVSDSAGFTFDNERQIHGRALAAFDMDERLVSNAEFAAFVDAGGYDDPIYWGGQAGVWRALTQRAHPARWRRAPEEGGTGSWEHRWFHQWHPLPANAPVCHINAFEAEAYCAWAGRRLPEEDQWEYAARSGAIRWGEDLWEWLANDFIPYPGFQPDRYRDYSAPWFGSHRVVRGASMATRPRLRHPGYRNFYLPDREDPFVGFRTCGPG